jgi:thiamine pyrophosphate-dependent acetolactate synthase large subunit-like protein
LALGAPALDHVALARGLGASAARVEREADLPAALVDLWRRAADGPAVLVVPVSGRTPPVGYPL